MARPPVFSRTASAAPAQEIRSGSVDRRTPDCIDSSQYRNLTWQSTDVSKPQRGLMKGQRPCVIWFTGLSGAGKSTIANLVEKKLCQMGKHTYLLDGDNVRHGLNKDLGFNDADRVENIRRIAEIARLMVDAGLIVMTAFISPFRAGRDMARALLEDGEFIEVFVDVPLEVARQRDPKGLYEKARRGELKNFTGLDSEYEAPESPELRIYNAELTPAAAVDRVFETLWRRGIIESGERSATSTAGAEAGETCKSHATARSTSSRSRSPCT